MAERFVRVTVTWEVPVLAEYGDTDEDLIAKASRPPLADGNENRTLLPAEITAADVAPEPEVTV